MDIITLSAKWDEQQYSLIDCGGGEKLERFGENILIRPEPQALWLSNMPRIEWEKMADAYFERSNSKGNTESDKGSWEVKRGVNEQWWIERRMPSGGNMRLRMGMTSFKHVGVFPEQGANWDFLQESIIRLRQQDNGSEEVKALNMFAYTGAASIAMAMAGAKVTHLDSVKAVNVWAKENANESGISNIRFITDDAMAFAARELRRGSKYRAIVLDPPAYGRGSDGQKWVLEEHIYEMISRSRDLLEMKSGSFILLSLYSMGFSSILAKSLVQQILGRDFEIEIGELYIEDSYSKQLPLGIFLRAIHL